MNDIEGLNTGVTVPSALQADANRLQKVFIERQAELQTELKDVNSRIAQNKIELADTRSQNDLSENAGYDIAKDIGGSLELRRRSIEKALRIIQESNLLSYKPGCKYVSVGSTVRLYHTERKTCFVYMIVPAEVSKVEAGLLSSKSPVGQVLLTGKKAGEIIGIRTSSGPQEYKIEEVY